MDEAYHRASSSEVSAAPPAAWSAAWPEAAGEEDVPPRSSMTGGLDRGVCAQAVAGCICERCFIAAVGKPAVRGGREKAAAVVRWRSGSIGMQCGPRGRAPFPRVHPPPREWQADPPPYATRPRGY